MKEQIYQDFTLDLTNILSDEVLADGQVPQLMKDFLIEGYNPLVDELMALSALNPNIKQDDIRVQNICLQLKKMVKDCGYDYVSESKDENHASNKGSYTHLSYLIKDLEADKTVNDSLNSLETVLKDQTKKDFEAGRMAPKLIDQNGEEFFLDGNSDFTNALKLRAKNENISFNDAFKNSLNLTNDQLNTLLTKFNQRVLEGAAVACVDPSKINVSCTERSNIFHIVTKNIEDNGVTHKVIDKVIAVENISRVDDTQITEDGVIVSPVLLTNYKIDLDSIDPKAEKALPIHKTNESFTFKAIDEKVIYEIPEALKTRSKNNKLIKSKESLSREEVIELMTTPNIKLELSEDNYLKLASQVNKEIIEDIIKGEFNKLAQEEKNATNDVKARKLQDKLANIFSLPEMKEDNLAKEFIYEYVKQKDPTILTIVSNYIHAAFHFTTVEKYREQKLSKNQNRINAKLLQGLNAQDVKEISKPPLTIMGKIFSKIGRSP